MQQIFVFILPPYWLVSCTVYPPHSQLKVQFKHPPHDSWLPATVTETSSPDRDFYLVDTLKFFLLMFKSASYEIYFQCKHVCVQQRLRHLATSVKMERRATSKWIKVWNQVDYFLIVWVCVCVRAVRVQSCVPQRIFSYGACTLRKYFSVGLLYWSVG